MARPLLEAVSVIAHAYWLLALVFGHAQSPATDAAAMSSTDAVIPALIGPVVQLLALDVTPGIARAAALHAIRRDAWAGVYRCALAAPSLRGAMRLEVRRRGGANEAIVRDAIAPARAEAARCVIHAVSRVHVPAVDPEPESGAAIRFELLFRERARRDAAPLDAPAPHAQRSG